MPDEDLGEIIEPDDSMETDDMAEEWPDDEDGQTDG